MMVQSPQDGAALVQLMDRPRRRQNTVGKIALLPDAVFGLECQDPFVERAGGPAFARDIEGMGDERPIAWPAIPVAATATVLRVHRWRRHEGAAAVCELGNGQDAAAPSWRRH